MIISVTEAYNSQGIDHGQPKGLLSSLKRRAAIGFCFQKHAFYHI